MTSRSIAPPPGFSDEYLEWVLSQPRLFDNLDPEPPTEPPVEPNKTESPQAEPDGAGPHEPESTPSATPFLLGPPGAPCDFFWDRFRKPLSEWQAGLEAIYEPFRDESWSVCTKEEWLYGVLHTRLVTRFERQATVPTEQEEREIHVICMLAKYYLIKREDMVQAHLPIYVEEALSDAIIQLTMGNVDFTE